MRRMGPYGAWNVVMSDPARVASGTGKGLASPFPLRQGNRIWKRHSLERTSVIPAKEFVKKSGTR
ncbi:hypothetical protein [Azospirillum endophyticum]